MSRLVAELARVERTIRMLDPEDLETLTGRTPHGDGKGGTRYERLIESHLGGAALQASGCVRLVVTGGGFGAGAGNASEVTPLGWLVLQFLGRAPEFLEEPQRLFRH